MICQQDFQNVFTQGEVAGAATTNTEAGAAGGEPGRKKRWQHCHRRHQQYTVINIMLQSFLVICHRLSWFVLRPSTVPELQYEIETLKARIGSDRQRVQVGFEKNTETSLSQPTQLLFFEHLMCNWTQPSIMVTDKLCKKDPNQPFRTQVFLRA